MFLSLTVKHVHPATYILFYNSIFHSQGHPVIMIRVIIASPSADPMARLGITLVSGTNTFCGDVHITKLINISISGQLPVDGLKL